jgi:hypothetical protein
MTESATDYVLYRKHSHSEFTKFMQTARRDLAKREEMMEMLKNPSVKSFVVFQEANMGGNYWRYWWLDSTGKWMQRIDSWLFSDWKPKFGMIEDGDLYQKDGTWKAVYVDNFHVRFDRQ